MKYGRALFLAAAEEFERGLGGGEAEVAGEEGVVDEAEFFGYFLDGVEAGEKEALGVENDVFADYVHRFAA